ncbi:uncharacterized protein LOC134541397 isoform X2 [Bacillus rossius redtenbacheri]|uniref:uncharacterized protein LOC134541397 isoform X2 n=1 Tax=Bacillus rossius redtenbacheri TaxID=93214 RepID=UPI002FDD3EAB
MASVKGEASAVIDKDSEELHLITLPSGKPFKFLVQSTGGVDVKEDKAVWDHSATRLLISEYDEKKQMVDSGKLKSHKIMWNLIAEEMCKQGYSYNNLQVENKWKSLDRAFKKYLSRRELTGRTKKVPFFKEMMEIHKRHQDLYSSVVTELQDEDVVMHEEVVNDSDVETHEMSYSEYLEHVTQIEENIVGNGESIVLTSTSPSKETYSFHPDDIEKREPPPKLKSVIYEIRLLRKSLIEQREARLQEKRDLELKKLKIKEAIFKQLKRKNDLLEELLKKL